MRDRPAVLGQWPDGHVPKQAAAAERAIAAGVDRRTAIRHPFFWVVTAGVATVGLLATAVAFHQISLLGARGLSPAEAAANFVPQTVAALTGTLVVGALADRIRHRWLIAGAMAAPAGALVLGTAVTPGVVAIAFGALVGAAGGGMRAVEVASFPHYFGTRHIGSIRGLVAPLPVLVGAAAFVVRPPVRVEAS